MIMWLITVESCVVCGPLITLSALGPVDMVQFLEDHETARQYRGKSSASWRIDPVTTWLRGAGV